MIPVALVVAFGIGVGAWWFGFARYTQTPSTVGLTEAKAKDRLTKDGFEVRVGEGVFSETIRKGRVVTTDPPPGDRVVSGGTITLRLSLGKERYDVPPTQRLTLAEAKAAISEHLAVGDSIERFHDTIPDGSVIRTDPKVGTRVRPDTVVDIVVSKGRKPIAVVDHTGENADDAEAAWVAKGLRVDRVERFSDDVTEGSIISQDPRSGTLYRGDTVMIVVSKGPDVVTIPTDLIAMTDDDARAELEALDLRVSVVHDSAYIGLDLVLGVDPEGGTEVPRGSTVTLRLI